MPFTFRAAFTGIFALVPNDCDYVNATRVTVIAPNASSLGNNGEPDISADYESQVDETKLRPHVPMLSVGNEFVENAPGLGHTLWYLNGRRISFQVDGVDATDDTLSVDYDQDKKGDYNLGLPAVAPRYPLNWLPHMELIAPAFNNLDGDVVSEQPPSRVGAQIVLRQGELYAGAIDRWLWSVPKVLAGQVNRQGFAHQVVAEIKNINNTVDVVAQSLTDPSDTETLRITSSDTNIDVTISHLCADNPLRWKTEPRQPEDDNDFRWYFELLPQARIATLRAELRGSRLPFPVRTIATGAAGGSGSNCMPCLFCQ